MHMKRHFQTHVIIITTFKCHFQIYVNVVTIGTIDSRMRE